MLPRVAIVLGLLAGIATGAIIVAAVVAYVPGPVHETPTPSPIVSASPPPSPSPTIAAPSVGPSGSPGPAGSSEPSPSASAGPSASASP